MKDKNKNIIFFLLVILLITSVFLNIQYKKDYIKLLEMNNNKVTLRTEDYLIYSLGKIYNSLISLSVLDDKDIYEKEIEAEFFKLTYFSSGLLTVLEIPEIYAKKNIFELYKLVKDFNQLLLTSSQSREYIHSNCDSFAKIIQEIIGCSYYIETEEFKEILIELQRLIKKYYPDKEINYYINSINKLDLCLLY